MITVTAAITALLLGGTTYTLAPVPPELRPDPTGRGYLGVTLGEGVVIDRIEPNAPAAKFGLRQADVILRVGTLHPRDYSEAVTHICSFRPGAIVEIEVQRGSERKIFKVKLGLRPAELDYTDRRPGVPVIED
ncbi:serine endoprotease [Gemmata sp. SH-PL17]|uniref:PDZ domain-containing protein n=1 Tax=Gemmata sp. SH-PL17 TaxID=1630693 RepID=UPI0004AD3CC6|nr:PDZ domain-containing protein [Gemmata sp. SH-PL17]AMV26361.1 serine endoprotease [Gemmata sp. SH-PL17]